MEIIEQIRGFVTSNFYVADPTALVSDASLLDRGIIDSTGVLEVILFIEDTFGIAVEDSEMLPDNLDSIERIANFVVYKNRLNLAPSVADTTENLIGDHP